MLEAVIFDMDGVIVDTEPVYFRAINEFLGKFGYSIDKRYNEKLFGISAYDAWAAIEIRILNWKMCLWKNVCRKWRKLEIELFMMKGISRFQEQFR